MPSDETRDRLLREECEDSDGERMIFDDLNNILFMA